MEASTIASILERLEAIEVKLGLKPKPESETDTTPSPWPPGIYHSTTPPPFNG